MSLGPWEVRSVCRLGEIGSADGFQIMDGDAVLVGMSEGNGWNKTQMEKILRLMAAAPELLSALKDAEAEIRRLHYLLTPHYSGKIGEPDLAVARKARAAITKAGGRKKAK